MQEPGGEELPYQFEGIGGFRFALCGESVHQVGMHQDAGAGQGGHGAGGAFKRNALAHQFQQAGFGTFQSPGERHAAGSLQQAGQVGIECRFEPDVAPPGHGQAAPDDG